MNKISKTEMVKDYIQKELMEGRLSYGKRLPSCRQLAKKLSMNKITVNKAYVLLEEEHQVYRIPKGGFYLVEMEEVRQHTDIIYDFRTVRPDEKLVPYREYTHCLNKAIELHRDQIFGYEMSLGLPTLRETLKERYAQEGVYTDDNHIMITNGAQQAIHIAFQCIFHDKNGALLIENPSYGLAIHLANQLGIELIGINRKVEGYDMKELENILKTRDIRAFYLIPRHHNPTGYSLSEKVKQKVVQLCNKYQVQIIEDDYLADLGGKKGEMPLHYYDTSKQVFYIRSFSKTFIPGIRIGTLVTPTNRIEKVLEYKRLIDLHTSVLPQAALDIFIKSGMYDKHIIKIRKVYERKLRKAKEILQSFHTNELSFYVPERGIFIWLQVKKEKLYKKKILDNLNERGIIIDFAEESFIENDKQVKNTNNTSIDPIKHNQCVGRNQNNCIRICIAGIQEENLDQILYILKEFSDNNNE